MNQRQTNIEILRIVAMLMVCALHANFLAMGAPSEDTVFSFNGLFRVICEFSCIMAVDTFVMISGWFGIKPSLKGFCKFIWQVIWIVGIVTCVGMFFLDEPLSHKAILQIYGLYNGGGWFVPAYIGLYIISPVLNSFVESHSKQYIGKFLIAFFLFEVLWGCTASADWIKGGNSIFSFIGLYILAGLLRKVNLKYTAWFYWKIFWSTVLLNSILYLISYRIGGVAVRDIALQYINPLVIIGAASLFMAFYKMLPPKQTITTKVVLFFSSSCFAVYLLHVGTEYALRFYCESVQHIYTCRLSLLAILGYIVGVFIMAMVIDQPRKLIWNSFLLKLFQKNAYKKVHG